MRSRTKTHPTAWHNWLRVRAELYRAVLSPPPSFAVSEWADRYRYLSREASAEPGKWDTDRAPYQREPMDVVADPTVEDVVLCWASQTGKTEALLNILGYYIDQEPSPILVLMPTLEMAHVFSKDRLATMLRDTPRLRGRVKDPRSRDSGNTLLHKQFPGGHLTIIGANSPASLAARPIRIVLADEIDRYNASAGTEGDPIALAFRRTATFWNRKRIRTSTPTVKGNSPIDKAFQESDQRYYYVPCPHCGHMQRLVWANLRWDDGRPETAAYECERCHALIEEQDKPEILRRGTWIAHNPGSRVVGYHLNALYSPWARWEELVREFLAAKDVPERLQTWVNTVLAETWEEQNTDIDADSLQARAETYPAEVPAGVGVLTASVDVQDDRIEVQVQGWGEGQEWWLVTHQRLFGDPEQPMLWSEVEAILTRRYRHESGALIRIRAAAIDTGYLSQHVYRFVRGKERRGVYAMKGSDERSREPLKRASRPNRYGVKPWTVNTVAFKDLLFRRLRIARPGPGYMHFVLQPGGSGADAEYYEQFRAEKVALERHGGRFVRRYKQIRPRNEAIDLYVLGLAALYTLPQRIRDHLGREAERLFEEAGQAKEPGEPQPETVTPATPRRPRRRVRAGWVDRWRL
jgi:phage terminase large subunit GpA-like protein